jgi:hypothetical protein
MKYYPFWKQTVEVWQTVIVSIARWSLAINNPAFRQGKQNGIVVYKENGDLADQGTVKMALALTNLM